MKDYSIIEYFKEKYKAIPQIDEYIKIMTEAKIKPRDIEQVLDIIAYGADPMFIEAKLGPEMAPKICETCGDRVIVFNDMRRKEEFKKVKEIIKENYISAGCGIFNSENIVGDQTVNIFDGDYFSVDICFDYAYYEVFGTTDEEWRELEQYYNKINIAISRGRGE